MDDPENNKEAVDFKVVVIGLVPLQCADLYYVLGSNRLTYEFPVFMQKPLPTPENGIPVFPLNYVLKNATGDELEAVSYTSQSTEV